MKDLIQTIRNIFSITELRQRILYTLLLLAVYRLGSFVVLPGINSNILQLAFSSGKAGAGGGILDLFNTFMGQAFSRGSLFALGVMPYISASIVVQLLAAVVPAIQKLRMEGDSGTKKMNQITRYLTIAITLGQSATYVGYLRGQYPQAVSDSPFFWFTTIFLITAGTMFLVWLGERITDNGIGNGTSLIITIGIVSGFLPALWSEIQTKALLVFFIELIVLGVVTMGVIALTQATRKIPLNYARQMVGSRQMMQMGKGVPQARQYIPLKMNSAGVMPIIFAQALIFLPSTLAQMIGSDSASAVLSAFSDYTGFWYNFFFSILIIVFTYFYTAITVNPNEIADQLKRNGGFIPGIKPGKKTAEYIDNILSKITLPGSITLALVALLPAVATLFGASGNFSKFFGGTTLLIMIGVVLDTLQQIEGYLLNRHYDGLMKSGRVKGRQASGVITS